MPDGIDSSLPPGRLQIDSEVFEMLIQRVIEAATRSAEGATKSAAAIQTLEGQLQELKLECKTLGSELKRLSDLEHAKQQNAAEHGKWLRSLIRPETLYYTLVIIAALLGAQWAQNMLGGTP